MSVVVGQQQIAEQAELANLRKHVVFPRLFDLPELLADDKKKPRFSVETDEEEFGEWPQWWNTVGRALYHRSFSTTPQETLHFVREQCQRLHLPVPLHDWDSAMTATQGMTEGEFQWENDRVIDHVDHELTDRHRLFLVLGLCGSSSQHVSFMESVLFPESAGPSWRDQLWEWPLLTPRHVVDLANALAMRDTDHDCTEEDVADALNLPPAVTVDLDARLN